MLANYFGSVMKPAKTDRSSDEGGIPVESKNIDMAASG
jgi:hypothetical protein